MKKKIMIYKKKKIYIHYLRLIILTKMKKSCEKRVMKVTLVVTNI